MILIFDDNSFRLNDLCKKLRFSNFPVKGAAYADWEYYNKPIITVFMYPSPSDVKYMSSTMLNQNTRAVFVFKKDIPEKKYCRNYIISPNGDELTAEKIKEIILKEYNYNFESDFINLILIEDGHDDIYFGHRHIPLVHHESIIVKFLAYNSGRVFTTDEIIEYLNLKISEATLKVYISNINSKCTRSYREDLILKKSVGYCITPAILRRGLKNEEIKRKIDRK
ncbi:MAG: helix-turn-helix domain-containing protein [Clostridia bacterium]|nr:helix-turn-helix domain-containing protein [Clostridia bacterium]